MSASQQHRKLGRRPNQTLFEFPKYISRMPEIWLPDDWGRQGGFGHHYHYRHTISLGLLNKYCCQSSCLDNNYSITVIIPTFC